MADNFNLRSFLTENKLTKNAQLLKEEKFYAPDYISQKYGAKAKEIEQNIFDAEETENNPNLWDNLTSLETPEEVDNFVQGFIDEEAAQGTDISGYWVMYGGLNKGVPQFIKMFSSEEEAQQALQDAPTTYGQHVLRGNWGIQSAQDWLASGKELGPDSTGHPDRVPRKRLSPEELAAIRQLDFDAEMEREGTQNKKPIMKETKLTAKERRLVEMVNNAMGYANNDEDQEFDPGQDIEQAQHDIERQYEGEDYGTNAVTGKPLPKPDPIVEDEMADETVIPEYNTIDELMNSIDHGTNKVAEEHKMQEMKKIAQMLREKAKKMEESEHAAHISPKDLKQLATDAAKLEKAAEKLKAAFDKKFNKKEKPAAAPKAEKVEALQEGFFDLRKFLAENRK